jgi:penicillin-binding protein 1A
MIRFFATLLTLLLVGVAAAAGVILWGFAHYGRDLPSYAHLAAWEPPTTTHVYAGDGRLLVEYAREPRVFVPITAIPPVVKQAFIAMEDKNFYAHPGVDVVAIVRSQITNLKNLAEDRRPIGGSTITQQVARLPGLSLLNAQESTLSRKIKEWILALRIERALPKDRILEIYLNEMYLGFGSYGPAQAALNYFNKAMDELTVAEAAYIAALARAPSNYHPIRYAERAKERRDMVIAAMLEEGFVTDAQAKEAWATPFAINPRTEIEIFTADYFVEEVRRELAQRYGTESLYGGGLTVRTTLDPRLQDIAVATLRDGLEDYDRRHGWRGPIARIEGPELGWPEAWTARLSRVKAPAGLGDDRKLAVVLAVRDTHAEIGFVTGAKGSIPMRAMTWARPWREDQRVGAAPRRPADVLAVGDVVAVQPFEGEGTFGLHQVPDIEGALVALDPHTGRVLAMVGGYSFQQSQFNRVTQAWRQPGSAFKPIVYVAALENGFTPASLVLDAPFVVDQGPGLGKWKPANYSQTFYGPSTLRLGIEKSRNLMTVRLAQHIGMDKVADYAERVGVVDKMPQYLSNSLGAAETTLMRLTAAYGMVVNGGKKITPTTIDRVQDRRGRTVFQHDARTCVSCKGVSWFGQTEPTLPDMRRQVIDPISAYQMTSMLEGVVQRGTGVTINAVKKPLGGKTGTTNDEMDTWWIGFSPDLVVGVWVGFDNPKSLGASEQGASAAAPIFRDFMMEALRGKPGIPFRVSDGVRLVRVNAETGHPAVPGDRNVILEAFRPGTEPTTNTALVLDNGFIPLNTQLLAKGLY